MHKIYLLLRNNKQTGPHSLDEIIKLELKPHDLIWVEGRSAGWRYPEEIDSLKDYVETTFPNQNNATYNSLGDDINTISFQSHLQAEEVIPKRVSARNSASHIFVSLPGGSSIVSKKEPEHVQVINEKNSSINNNEVNYNPDKHNTFKNETDTSSLADIKVSRSFDEVKEDYTNWVFKKRKKGPELDKNKIILVGLAALLLIGAYIGVSKFISPVADSGPEIAKSEPATKKMQSATVAIKESAPENSKQPISLNNSENNYNAPASTEQNVSKPIEKIFNSRKGFVAKATRKSSKHNNAIVTKSILPKKDVRDDASPISHSNTNVIASAPVKQSTVPNASSKKKKIGEFFNTVFGKLKSKKNEEPSKTSTVSIPQQMPGERRSVKREETNSGSIKEASESIPSIPVRQDLLEVAGPEKSESWQLGIYNLKLTIYNHNPVSVKNAQVEVVYLDENDRVLEKKNLNFTNIPAKGSLTLRAPDQKWADHVDYSLVAFR